MAYRYYLAYGSNLNVEQMRYRCPAARVIGTAEIENYELLFKGSKTGAYLTIEPKKGSSVPVAVWDVTPQDEKRLDFYEGYPDFYYKKEMRVTVKGIKTGKERIRNAFVYIMHEERPVGEPSLHYVRACMDGYKNFKFPLGILTDAYLKAKGITWKK